MSPMTSQTESVGFDPQLTTTRNCCVSVNLPEQPCGRVPFTGRQCFIWTLALNHYRCTVCPRRRKKKVQPRKDWIWQQERYCSQEAVLLQRGDKASHASGESPRSTTTLPSPEECKLSI